jgi:hypothetical protein
MLVKFGAMVVIYSPISLYPGISVGDKQDFIVRNSESSLTDDNQHCSVLGVVRFISELSFV